MGWDLIVIVIVIVCVLLIVSNSRGVNMRYLGLVYHQIKRFHQEEATMMIQIILVEMCARVLKNKLRAAFRKVLKGLKVCGLFYQFVCCCFMLHTH
jgi:hypothetical protein